MFDSALVYQSLNGPVLAQVPRGSRVLDVGCGGGAMGAWLTASHGCTVVGVTHNHAEAEAARGQIEQVVIADLDSFDPAPLGRFDCVICSHVLEHLSDPQRLLAALRQTLASEGVLVVALPNVLFWRQRLEFMRGRFAYSDGGLMDRTHIRFFDWDTAAQLLRDAGYALDKRDASGSVPGSRRLGRALSRHLDRVGLELFPGLFGFQFVLRARPAQQA